MKAGQDHLALAREALDDAQEQSEGSRSRALVGIGYALLEVREVGVELLAEQRTQTLVLYLQALLADPHPGTDTVAQIQVIAATIERRLGLAGALT